MDEAYSGIGASKNFMDGMYDKKRSSFPSRGEGGGEMRDTNKETGDMPRLAKCIFVRG